MGAGGLTWAMWPRKSRFATCPPGRVELIYWEKWTDLEGQAMQNVVDWFNQSQSRIWVNKVTIADIAAKAMVAIGGNDPPDVVGLFNYNIPQYAEAAAVIPIESFKGSEVLGEALYTPALWRLLSHEGKQWGGVSACHSLAFYYNRARFRDANIASPPKTIAELDALMDRFTERDAKGGIKSTSFCQPIPDWWLFFWPFLFGGDIYDQVANRATMDSPECISAFQWVSDCAARLGREEGRAFASSFNRSIDSADDPFFNARVAMIMQGPWIANFARTYKPSLDFAVAPLPVDAAVYDPAQPITMIEADVLMIPKGCPHPEEAFEFLLFTQRREVHERLAAEHFKPSGLRSVSPEFVSRHPHPFIKVHNDMMQSPRARVQPRTRTWKEYSDLINGAFDAIWKGDDVGRQLTTVQSRIQSVIDDSAARLRQRRGHA